MSVIVLVVVLVLGVVPCYVRGEDNNGSPRDSYLDAYADSHDSGGTVNSVNNDREFTEPLPYPPSQPGYHYGPPKFTYGPPVAPVQPVAPIHNYGPPVAPLQPAVPPAHNYGPPPSPIYGPPAPAPIYGAPHAMLGLLDHFKLKLDLFTLGKILLKIVLFKKLVSFIAIICLLLFIPSLKHKFDDALPDNGDGGGDDEAAMRTFFGSKKYRAGDEFLNNIATFVMGAIDNYSKNYTEKDHCDGTFCRTKRVVAKTNKQLDDKKLAKIYAKEIK